MGGLRQYMPVTFCADVDRDARDRRHSAVRRLLLEGRDPRRGVRAGAALDDRRARTCSAFRAAHWLYLAYVLGVAAAFMTATYMTRMMIYTFHGPNRTGEKEREHLHEAPWIMTGPLVVLGVLTVIGGWLNIPEFAKFLGPVGASRSLARAGGRRVDGARDRRRRRRCRRASSTASSASRC